MEPSQERTPSFSDDEVARFGAYFAVLKRIHARLLAEGYEIRDGEIIHRCDSTPDDGDDNFDSS